MTDLIVRNLAITIVAVIIIAGVIDIIKNGKDAVNEWLLLAVISAETEFGGKTGIIKLRYVYDLFVARFTFVSKFITFDEFSDMVDEALVQMRHLIETNAAIYTMVNGKSPVKEE